MPASCVIPNRFPLGSDNNISAVSGSCPWGPAVLVRVLANGSAPPSSDARDSSMVMTSVRFRGHVPLRPSAVDEAPHLAGRVFIPELGRQPCWTHVVVGMQRGEAQQR